MALLNPESNQITKLFADTPTAKRAKTNTVDLDRVLDIEAERVTTRELSGRL